MNGLEQLWAVSLPSSTRGIASAWIGIPDGNTVHGSVVDCLEKSPAVGESMNGVKAFLDSGTILDVAIHYHVRVGLVDSFQNYLLAKDRDTLYQEVIATIVEG